MQDRDASGAVLIDIDAGLSCWQRMDDGATSELVFLFHEWEPAIRVGIHAYLAYPECDFDSIRSVMLDVYERIRGRSRIPWVRAAPTARRVWQKLHDQNVHDRSMQGRNGQQARYGDRTPPHPMSPSRERREAAPRTTEMPLVEA